MGFTSSELGEEKKQVWAGLRRAQVDLSAVKEEIERLKDTIGDYSTFKTEVSNDSNFSEFKTTLTDNGWTDAEADAYIDKIKSSFTDEDSSGTVWDEFSDKVSNTDSYDELSNAFGTQTGFQVGETEDGSPTAGIRVLEGGGVTYAGVSTSVTTTEVFGRRIEFSQADAARAEDGTINYSNLTTDDADNVVDVFTDITISVDVENTNSGERAVSVALTRDGSVVQEKNVTIGGNSTKTVSFTESYDEYVCYDYTVADLSAITVCWAPGGLTAT